MSPSNEQFISCIYDSQKCCGMSSLEQCEIFFELKHWSPRYEPNFFTVKSILTKSDSNGICASFEVFCRLDSWVLVKDLKDVFQIISEFSQSHSGSSRPEDIVSRLSALLVALAPSACQKADGTSIPEPELIIFTKDFNDIVNKFFQRPNLTSSPRVREYFRLDSFLQRTRESIITE